MQNVTLSRVFDAAPEKVFAFVTQAQHLLKWWCHETTTVPEHALSFEALGPWAITMLTADGQRFKLSGQVTSVNPPRSVGFTWAWHDADDVRGGESHVTIQLEGLQDGGTRLTLTHVNLADADAVEAHTGGWTLLLHRLETYFVSEASTGVHHA